MAAQINPQDFLAYLAMQNQQIPQAVPSSGVYNTSTPLSQFFTGSQTAGQSTTPPVTKIGSVPLADILMARKDDREQAAFDAQMNQQKAQQAQLEAMRAKAAEEQAAKGSLVVPQRSNADITATMGGLIGQQAPVNDQITQQMGFNMGVAPEPIRTDTVELSKPIQQLQKEAEQDVISKIENKEIKSVINDKDVFSLIGDIVQGFQPINDYIAKELKLFNPETNEPTSLMNWMRVDAANNNPEVAKTLEIMVESQRQKAVKRAELQQKTDEVIFKEKLENIKNDRQAARDVLLEQGKDTRQQIAIEAADERQRAALEAAAERQKAQLEAMLARLDAKSEKDKTKEDVAIGKEVRALRKEYEGHQTIKAYNAVTSSYNKVMESIKAIKDKKIGYNALDQIIVMEFNKLLDPKSVVKEGEFARTPKNMALYEKIKAKASSIAKGGLLSNEERSSLYNAIIAMKSGYTPQYEQVTTQFNKEANKLGVEKDRVTGGTIAPNVSTLDALIAEKKRREEARKAK